MALDNELMSYGVGAGGAGALVGAIVLLWNAIVAGIEKINKSREGLIKKDDNKEQYQMPLKAPGGFTHDQCPVNPSIMTTLTKLSTLSDTTAMAIAEVKMLITANHNETKNLFDEVWTRLRKVEDTTSINTVEIEHLKKR